MYSTTAGPAKHWNIYWSSTEWRLWQKGCPDIGYHWGGTEMTSQTSDRLDATAVWAGKPCSPNREHKQKANDAKKKEWVTPRQELEIHRSKKEEGVERSDHLGWSVRWCLKQVESVGPSRNLWTTTVYSLERDAPSSNNRGESQSAVWFTTRTPNVPSVCKHSSSCSHSATRWKVDASEGRRGSSSVLGRWKCSARPTSMLSL